MVSDSKTNNNPTVDDTNTDLGSTTQVGNFEGEIKALQPETTYYVRAFAKNSIGVAYGGTITITTKVAPPPVVNGLIVYYTFNEQNCDDQLGEIDYNGIVQGTGTEMNFVKDTPDGKGFALKGSNGGKYYKILRAPEQDKADISYSVWVKTKATQTEWYGVRYSYNSGYDYNFGVKDGHVIARKQDFQQKYIIYYVMGVGIT